MAEEDGNLVFTRKTSSRESRALHGLSRALGYNMVHGVSEGWEKNLKLIGVGYRAQADKKNVKLQVGKSHDVILPIPATVEVEVAKGNTDIKISGPDKELVGNFAAQIRSERPPEPYKGKGVRYTDEYVLRKEGKAGKK